VRFPSFLSFLSLPSLSRLQVQILQVFLMLIILVHNTSTCLAGVWPLSEFGWQKNYLSLWGKIFEGGFQGGLFSSTDWKLIPLILLSTGYTAVAGFIILTAYGLSKRYQSEPLFFIPYFKRRLVYLFLPWCVIAIWMELLMVHAPSAREWLLNFSTLAIWVPHHQSLILGPWWFLAMIFQLYLIFPLLLKAHKKFGGLFLIFICLIQYVCQVWVNPWTLSFGLNLNITPLASLIPLSIGLFWASKNLSIGRLLIKQKLKKSKLFYKKTILIIIGIGLVFLFFMAQLSSYIWPFANSLLGVFLLGVGKIFFISPNPNIPISHWLKHLTTLIVPVYLIHGYIYPFFYPYLMRPDLSFWVYMQCLIAIGLVTYLCAILVREIVRNLYDCGVKEAGSVS